MSKTQYDESHTDPAKRQPIPWLWLGLGLVVTVIGLIAVSWLLGGYLTAVPETAGVPGPTIIRLTAPPLPTATAALVTPIPTAAATATTMPTRDLSIAPAEVSAGYYAIVAGTGGIGVTVRNGPSTSNQPVTVAGEGSYVLVIEGPIEGDSYVWWNVRLPDGTEGWAAGDFLAPSAAP